MDKASSILTTVITKSLPSRIPPPPPDLNTAIQPPTPESPPLINTNSIPKSGMFLHSLVHKTRCPPILSVNPREQLRSLVESIMEGTRQTDQIILKMRTILAESDVTDEEDNSPPVLPTSSSTQSFLAKHLPPSSSSSISNITSSPYPSPSPSPRVHQVGKFNCNAPLY
jgi:hypothetical protein